VNVRSPLEATVAALVILVGLLIGGMFAILTRTPNQQAQRVTVATANSAPRVPHGTPSATPRTPAAAAVATPAAVTTTAPTATPEPAATPTPTATPTPKPTATATPAPSRTATPTPATAPGAAPRAGSWRIEEANVQVGTIVWSGAGTASGGRNAIVLDVHKESVAGHAVSLCERRTTLHAVLPAGSPQTVPYREVNCSGAASTGEMRVTSVSGDGSAFSGSFWSNGSKLGDFTALLSR
jgi:hypothetical protein